MEKQNHIIFIEHDDIGLFLAESLVEDIRFEGPVGYYSDAEGALAYLHGLQTARVESVSLFVSTRLLMGEEELLKQFRELVHPFAARICLLTSMEGAAKEEETFIEDLNVACIVEKPLTEEKLIAALLPATLSSAKGRKR